MLTVKNYFKDHLPAYGEPTKTTVKNAEYLIWKANKISDIIGERFVQTSGWRPEAYNRELYERLIVAGKADRVINSAHIYGLAIDIKDSFGTIYKWCYDHLDDLKVTNITIELHTKGWVHFEVLDYTQIKLWGT